MNSMQPSRRNFLGKVATGLAGTIAPSVLGANDRVRVGLIVAWSAGRTPSPHAA